MDTTRAPCFPTPAISMHTGMHLSRCARTLCCKPSAKLLGLQGDMTWAAVLGLQAERITSGFSHCYHWFPSNVQVQFGECSSVPCALSLLLCY